jgi:hypothetical protein
MTQNLKSLLKFAFKSTKKSNQNSFKTNKKKFKNIFSSKNKNETASKTSKYLTRYNCKNKKIDNTTISNTSGSGGGGSGGGNDDTISNLMPFNAIQTQLLIPPPVPPLPTTKQEMMLMSGMNKMTKLRNQIELKLISANKSKPANLPMLVVRSYNANSSISLKQLSIRKGSAVNALYMLCNNWVYVKTFDDEEGFVPKYCFESFISTQNNNDSTLINETPNHTYMSIVENNNSCKEKIINESDEENDEEITNLSLFSVSRCLNIDSTILTTTSRRTTRSVKSYSKKFYYKSTINKPMRHYNLRSVEKKLSRVKMSSEIKFKRKIKRCKSVSSTNSSSSSSSSSLVGDTYDLLVKCSSSKEDKNVNKIVYKVLCDYTADFKDDISVKRGDTVYSVHNENNNNNDWIYVKPYKKRNSKSSDDDGGFIPRDYLVPL